MSFVLLNVSLFAHLAMIVHARRRIIDRTLDKPDGVEAAVLKHDGEGSEEENAPLNVAATSGCEQEADLKDEAV